MPGTISSCSGKPELERQPAKGVSGVEDWGDYTMMGSSQTITLFGAPQPSRWRPSGPVMSMLVHGVAMIGIYACLKHTPKVVDPWAERYTVRILNLHRPTPKIQYAALKGSAHPALKTVSHTVMRGGGHPARPSGSRHLAQLTPAPQTLVQPDLPQNLVLPQETPVPLALLWATENNPTEKIVPPPLQEITNASVEPSLDPPNPELKLADLRVSPTPFRTELPMPAPSTSSPLTVYRPDAPNQVPQTGSQSVTPPTPARVMSLSDVLLQQGSVPLPMINETTPSSADSFAPERPDAPPEDGSGDQAGKQPGMGAGQTPGDQGDAAAGTSGQDGAGNEPAYSRILLPKDGHFGVVVVGSSPADEYPEAQGVWTDRLAYTVYLHVGLARSWIMQYSLPLAAEAAAGGDAVRPDAPWPFVVVRPHLAPGDTNGDAIMVHGLINIKGQFEQLAVVFPQQFPQSQFVLSALRQWQFRPATQNGEITPVEVLLIIPRES